jgi:hypothetical protein
VSYVGVATLSAFCEAWAFELRISEWGFGIEGRIAEFILATALASPQEVCGYDFSSLEAFMIKSKIDNPQSAIDRP